MENHICLKYAQVLKKKGVQCISDFIYVGRCNYDENEWIIERNPPNPQSNPLCLPALTITELQSIIKEANHEVNIQATDLIGGIRVRMTGKVKLDIETERGERSNADLLVECLFLLMKKKVINHEFVNSVLIKRQALINLNIERIESAFNTLKEAIDSLRYAISPTLKP